MPRRGVYEEQESFLSSRAYAVMVLTTAALNLKWQDIFTQLLAHAINEMEV